MIWSIIILNFIMTTEPVQLFDFNKNADVNQWRIVDDVVMGGRSDGSFYINDEGQGVFEGEISLENNGGFSSVRYSMEQLSVVSQTAFEIRLRGDGKRYQFRVQPEASVRHSYIHYFQTSGEWQIIEIPFKEMYPSFRGRRLEMDNFPGKTMSEIAFLIGNKEAEKFQLEIDWIKIK